MLKKSFFKVLAMIVIAMMMSMFITACSDDNNDNGKTDNDDKGQVASIVGTWSNGDTTYTFEENSTGKKTIWGDPNRRLRARVVISEELFTYTINNGVVEITFDNGEVKTLVIEEFKAEFEKQDGSGGNDTTTVDTTIIDTTGTGKDTTGTGDNDIFETWDFGEQGDNLNAVLYMNRTLVISGIGSMGDFTFSNKSPWWSWGGRIDKVVIEYGVTNIGNEAFSDCRNLTEITIPNSVTSIGNGAFSRTGLTSITIPNSVTSIGNDAFSRTGLTSITIPNSVTSMGSSVFNNCTSLVSAIIGDGVTSIGQQTFYNCVNLTSVIIGNGVGLIDHNAFTNCTSLTEITIGNSVHTIRDQAFQNCRNLTEINLPAGVRSVSGGAFWGCVNLVAINVATDNEHLSSYNGVLFSGGLNDDGEYVKNHLMIYPVGKQQSTYIIPDGVRSVAQNAFANNAALTSLTIPVSITSFGWDPFPGLVNLTEIINLSPVPQTTAENIFDRTNKAIIVLYVPAESVDAYRADEFWGLFENIEAIE